MCSSKKEISRNLDVFDNLYKVCLEKLMCSTEQIGTPIFDKISSAKNDEHIFRIFSRWLLLPLVHEKGLRVN